MDALRNDPAEPLLARDRQGLYVPGSIMKVFTAAAALDAGVITPDTTFPDQQRQETDGLRRRRLHDPRARPRRHPARHCGRSPRRSRSRATSSSPTSGSSWAARPSSTTRAASASAQPGEHRGAGPRAGGRVEHAHRGGRGRRLRAVQRRRRARQRRVRAGSDQRHPVPDGARGRHDRGWRRDATPLRRARRSRALRGRRRPARRSSTLQLGRRDARRRAPRRPPRPARRWSTR